MTGAIRYIPRNWNSLFAIHYSCFLLTPPPHHKGVCDCVTNNGEESIGLSCQIQNTSGTGSETGRQSRTLLLSRDPHTTVSSLGEWGREERSGRLKFQSVKTYAGNYPQNRSTWEMLFILTSTIKISLTVRSWLSNLFAKWQAISLNASNLST